MGHSSLRNAYVSYDSKILFSFFETKLIVQYKATLSLQYKVTNYCILQTASIRTRKNTHVDTVKQLLSCLPRRRSKNVCVGG